jgi:hypothetical protein
MKYPLKFSLLVFFAFAPELSVADDMKAFPPAEPGAVRYVLSLPKQAHEEDYKLELIAGSARTPGSIAPTAISSGAASRIRTFRAGVTPAML